MIPLVLFALLALGPSPRVPRSPTPIAAEALPALLSDAHLAELGERPGRFRVAMAVAIVRWENGNGQKVYQHNLGNLGALPGALYYLDAGGYYAALPGFPEAARYFWRHLAASCARALVWFDAGDVAESAAALKRCGYFSAPLDQYEAGLRRLYRLR